MVWGKNTGGTSNFKDVDVLTIIYEHLLPWDQFMNNMKISLLLHEFCWINPQNKQCFDVKTVVLYILVKIAKAVDSKEHPTAPTSRQYS